jgi:hypothetical protein
MLPEEVLRGAYLARQQQRQRMKDQALLTGDKGKQKAQLLLNQQQARKPSMSGASTSDAVARNDAAHRAAQKLRSRSNRYGGARGFSVLHLLRSSIHQALYSHFAAVVVTPAETEQLKAVLPLLGYWTQLGVDTQVNSREFAAERALLTLIEERVNLEQRRNALHVEVESLDRQRPERAAALDAAARSNDQALRAGYRALDEFKAVVAKQQAAQRKASMNSFGGSATELSIRFESSFSSRPDSAMSSLSELPLTSRATSSGFAGGSSAAAGSGSGSRAGVVTALDVESKRALAAHAAKEAALVEQVEQLRGSLSEDAATRRAQLADHKKAFEQAKARVAAARAALRTTRDEAERRRIHDRHDAAVRDAAFAKAMAEIEAFAAAHAHAAADRDGELNDAVHALARSAKITYQAGSPSLNEDYSPTRSALSASPAPSHSPVNPVLSGKGISSLAAPNPIAPSDVEALAAARVAGGIRQRQGQNERLTLELQQAVRKEEAAVAALHMQMAQVAEARLAPTAFVANIQQAAAAASQGSRSLPRSRRLHRGQDEAASTTTHQHSVLAMLFELAVLVHEVADHCRLSPQVRRAWDAGAFFPDGVAGTDAKAGSAFESPWSLLVRGEARHGEAAVVRSLLAAAQAQVLSALADPIRRDLANVVTLRNALELDATHALRGMPTQKLRGALTSDADALNAAPRFALTPRRHPGSGAWGMATGAELLAHLSFDVAVDNPFAATAAPRALLPKRVGGGVPRPPPKVVPLPPRVQ